jgi:hypothetical protein
MIGKAVTMSADDTVALAADADVVIGKLISVEADLKCSVRVHGYVTLPGGNGATLTRGLAIVGALNASSEKGYPCGSRPSGTAAEILKARGRIINNGTTTAVGILLGA